MAGHSRSKNGVASLAYVPAIHVLPQARKAWMPAFAGMTENVRQSSGATGGIAAGPAACGAALGGSGVFAGSGAFSGAGESIGIEPVASIT
jgi:hypothetical protein